MFNLSVFGRLKLWQTFLILSLIGLVLASIPTYFYLREAGKALEAYTQEQAGLPAVAKVLKVIQNTQQHRGLSALYLGGVAGAEDKRAAKQREADEAYVAVGLAVAAIGNPAFTGRWNIALREWETLKAGVSGKTITVPESYLGHVTVLAKLLKINEMIGDHYGLSLDPDKDTYQLIQSVYYQLPALSEELGQLRAKGAGLLAKKSADQAERNTISAIIARVNDRMDQTANAFAKSARENPEIGATLSGLMEDATRQAKALTALAAKEIVTPEALEFAPADYVDISTKAIDAQFTINTAASVDLKKRIEDKIAAFHDTRWMMLGSMAALIALAGYMAWMITRAVTGPLNNAVLVAQSVARGNLVNDFEIGSDNEVGRMLRALKEMNNSLGSIVGDVRTSIEHIGTATREIATGNADVSARLESQASNLEETASSMEELTSTVKQNAENARQANDLVLGASQAAGKGGSVVSHVVQTMGEINEGSRKIVDIIAVIDGIAFQTNILALNAAVEAARAGEQGRGFAVVAAEVRNLAQRSASAAKEIKDLINHSVEKVEAGNLLADQAGVAMGEIQNSVRRITAIMSEIAVASAEQGAGIEQINHAVTQMDDMTQQNAALVEQTAAASSSLQEQAAALVTSMSIFTLADAEMPALRAVAAPPRLAAQRRRIGVENWEPG
jgi:methyl-accepting chemotaxis protein